MHQASDTNAHSKVSGFLSTRMAPEIQKYLMAPALNPFLFRVSSPY